MGGGIPCLKLTYSIAYSLFLSSLWQFSSYSYLDKFTKKEKEKKGGKKLVLNSY